MAENNVAKMIEDAKQRGRIANFKRISKNRTEKLLHSIKLIGNLAGPDYVFDPKDVFGMFGEIQQALIDAQVRFEKSKIFREAGASFYRSDVPSPIPIPAAPVPKEETDAQEQIRLQRQVIDNLQKRLDELKGRAG
jgi:hypothetical protein